MAVVCEVMACEWERIVLCLDDVDGLEYGLDSVHSTQYTGIGTVVHQV